MERQTICIIGAGLTGLITALTLSKLNLKIDLISDDIQKNINTNRTTAISQENYNYLKKLKFFDFSNKDFWPCMKMKLYSENKSKKFAELFELDSDEKNKKKIFYMMNNSKIIKQTIKNIKSEKLITFKNENRVSGIVTSGLLKSIKFKHVDHSKYNLVIICSGSNSSLVKNFFEDKSFERSYKELGITTILKHNKLKNNVSRQIFSDEGIFALLPISDTKTSIVWSIKKKIINKSKNKKNQFIKEKIYFYTKSFLKNINIIAKIESKDLNFTLRKKYYSDRVFFFGDALHQVHPLAGQGFNMTLRDLIALEEILKTKVSLGLDIGSYDVLSEFSNKIKAKNFVYSIGIDLLKNSLSVKNKYFKEFRNSIITSLDKNTYAKKFFYNIANKGLRF